jgi:hypothetical protein
MKKIYLQPEMVLTDCFMLRALCGSDDQPPQNPDDKDPFGAAPARKVF